MPQPTRPVRILTVCTGNVCRSPYAAFLLQEGFDEVRPGGFVVASAGTHALVGSPVDPGSARLLEEQGLDPTGFRARLVSPGLLDGADLVLAMAPEHVPPVIEEAPTVHRRTVLLLDVAKALVDLAREEPWPRRLARHGIPDEPLARWQALPGIIARDAPPTRRRRRREKAVGVTDPYGGPPRLFRQMADELEPACATLAAWEGQFSGS